MPYYRISNDSINITKLKKYNNTLTHEEKLDYGYLLLKTEDNSKEYKFPFDLDANNTDLNYHYFILHHEIEEIILSVIDKDSKNIENKTKTYDNNKTLEKYGIDNLNVFFE